VITGHVYRVRTTLVDPPKNEIVLCVGGFFLWFNTEPRQRPGQMKVISREAPGITRDCHLDCGRVTVFPDHELRRRTIRAPVHARFCCASSKMSKNARRRSSICTGAK
jgi:hypothetical protein